jgi:uncharacterized radical SAM superfamily protein
MTLRVECRCERSEKTPWITISGTGETGELNLLAMCGHCGRSVLIDVRRNPDPVNDVIEVVPSGQLWIVG